MWPKSAVKRYLSVPWLEFISIFFAVGIWSGFYLKPSFEFTLMSLCFSLCFSFLFLRKVSFIFISFVLFFQLGVLFAAMDLSSPPNDVNVNAPNGRLILEGTVASLPEVTVRGKKETVSFVLNAERFMNKKTSYQTDGKVQVFLHNPKRQIYFGDRLKLKGEMEEPKRVTNPHVFDYGKYLQKNGISKTFRGIGYFSVLRQNPGEGNRFMSLMNRVRLKLKERISRLFPSPYHELAAALILGFKKNIPDDIQDDFIKTGTAHLLAISGLNISLLAGLFHFCVGFTRLNRFCHFMLTTMFVLCYIFLAGANPPVVRAGIMGAVILIGFLLGHERNLQTALFFAFLVLLILNPKTLFSSSFQLSFSAMASLIFILPKLQAFFPNLDSSENLTSPFLETILEKIKRDVFQTFLASVAVTIGMFPILTWYFNLFSPVGFMANIVAVPVCTAAIASTLIVIMTDFIAPFSSGFLSLLPLWLLKFEVAFINLLARIPFGYFYLVKPAYFLMILYYGALISWLWFKKIKWIRAGSVFCIFLFSIYLVLIPNQRAQKVTFFDMGKSESLFIQFANGQTCLINTGRRFPNNQAYWILRPFFMSTGRARIDSILLTDTDHVHAGGLKTVLKYVRVKHIYYPEERLKKSGGKYIPLHFRNRHTLKEGDEIQFGANAAVRILSVLNGKIIALEVRDGSEKILYISKIFSETHLKLLQNEDVKYDIVILPHETAGIRSETLSYIKRISAAYVIINERENWMELKNYLKGDFAYPVLFPAETGALQFTFNKKGYTLQNFS